MKIDLDFPILYGCCQFYSFNKKNLIICLGFFVGKWTNTAGENDPCFLREDEEKKMNGKLIKLNFVTFTQNI